MNISRGVASFSRSFPVSQRLTARDVAKPPLDATSSEVPESVPRLLEHEVVSDYAGDLHWLFAQNRG